MPLTSPPPHLATPDALLGPDVPLKAGKKRRNPPVDPANMIDGTRRRFKSRGALGRACSNFEYRMCGLTFTHLLRGC
jgi:hypothetical protein